MIDPEIVEVYRHLRQLYDASSDCRELDELLRQMLNRPVWSVTMHDVIGEEGPPPAYTRGDMHRVEDWLSLREIRRELDRAIGAKDWR